MPLAQLYILEGRTEEQKQVLIRNVTEAICKSIDAPAESVRVLIQEVPKTNWGIGGDTAKALGR